MKRRYFFICYESVGISQTNNAPGKIIGQLLSTGSKDCIRLLPPNDRLLPANHGLV